MANIAVFGAGYAGLVTGVCFAELGHNVAIRDVVPEKIDRLRAGKTPIYEPGLEELMERNDERLAYTLDMDEALEGSEFLFVCVGTPPTYSADAVEALHEGLDAPVVKTDVPSAEMVKLAANAYLGTRISFINEIANVCELVGADVEQVARGMGLDRRIGEHYLRAGIGFGGSCFPKDISFLKLLAGNSGYHFQLLNAVIEVNDLQKRRVVSKLQKHLGPLRGKRIALLGLAFKPDTDDMREAPSKVLAGRLVTEGADVRAYDPVAKPGDLVRGVTLCDSVREAVRDADAAVIVTDWEEFRSLASPEIRDAMRRPLIVDGRNMLDPEAVHAAGFDYEGIGRASSPLAALPETAERDTEFAE